MQPISEAAALADQPFRLRILGVERCGRGFGFPLGISRARVMHCFLHFPALLQDYNAQCDTFLHRTDDLVSRLNIRIEDLPPILGLSRRTLFACRSADSAVTGKSWRKLEAAERAAGIAIEEGNLVPHGTRLKGSDVENSGNPNNEKGGELEKVQRQLDEMNARIQAALAAAFTIDELQTRMEAAGAWPASEADGKLTPGQLWAKYAPK